MTIGVFSFELHLAGGRSLKDKRQVVRRVKDRLRARFNVAVAETEDHHELWQRAGLVVVSVASNRDALETRFEAVRTEVETHVPGTVVDTGVEYIDGSDAGAGSWDDEGWQ